MVTLEQANQCALAAAHSGDLPALGLALRERGRAIVELNSMIPSAHLAARMAAAIQAGESISRALGALQQRIRFESARLAQLESGLATGLGFSRNTHISCRG